MNMRTYFCALTVLWSIPIQSFAADKPGQQPEAKQANASRETARQEIVHLEESLILDIPEVPRLCDRMHVVKRRVNVGDCELYCELEGDGTPLVLVHGGPGGTHHVFHPSFSTAKSFAKLIYFDQRGCGLSDYKREEGYSVGQAVDDLENLRKALSIDRWVVLGHSYGGALAQSYAVEYPDSVLGLVLVASDLAMPAARSTRQYDFISPEELKRIRAIHADRELTMEQKVYNAMLNGDWKRQLYYKPSDEKTARMARYEWKHDAGFNAVVSDSLREIDVRGAFDGCPIPTLIIEGKWDLTWDTDKPAILHKNHPNARLVVLEQSGHVPYDDQPEEFFAVLQDYVVNLPQVAPDDLHRWAVHLSKWKEEKEKEDPFLVEEMSKAEARAIEDFRRKREQILAGATYQDTSTPLDAYLTLLSAAHSGDTDALKRVLAVDTEKMTVMVGADATSMMMAGVKDYVFEVDVLRAPVPPRDPEHGTIWPVYVTKAKEASLADTFLLVFWNGEWAWCGNMASPMKWRPALPQFKAVLKRFGK